MVNIAIMITTLRTTTMQPIIIIGTGLAGYNLAKEIRKLDKEIPITLITADGGEFYHKPQLSTGMAKHREDAAGLVMAPAEKMAENFNLNILTHTLIDHIDIEKKELILSDKRLPYHKLVLAVGANPVKALFNGAESEHVSSVNNLDDYFAFRKHIKDTSTVTILGAGLVGCEFADDLANAGYKVNVIAPSLTPLDTLSPPEVGKSLQHVLEQKGVSWYLGNTAIEIAASGSEYTLTLSNGETLHSEYVLSAIGIRPNISLAKKSGIHTNKGIVVDDHLQTNVDNIFALGDCAEVNGVVLPYIAPIQHCVKSLAKILLDEKTPVHYPPMPVIIKTPSLPIITLPPDNMQGQWQIESDGNNITALKYEHDKLKGFVLTGDKVKERMQWLKKIT
jgi:rubredoxin-NAD+ reductase